MVLALATCAAPAVAQEVPRLGGYLTLDRDQCARWAWSAAWLYPVGDPFDYTRPVTPDGRGFALLRGVRREGGRHDGADLGDGSAGEPVHAAANGVVIRAEANGAAGGYGRHLVLAHRLAEGGYAYTVYAHLRRSGHLPREGDAISLGQVIGEVGRSGRASTDHLHFEVRRPRELGERWERSPVVDPLAFVAARLPLQPSGEVAPVVLWAAGGDLMGGGDDPGAPLARRAWWHMLWRSARHDGDVLPDGPRSLAEALIDAQVLPADAARRRGGVVTWDELARDLERLRACGVRLPPAPVEAGALRAWCEHELGAERPGRQPSRLARHGAQAPTVEQALLVLADLAGEPAP